MSNFTHPGGPPQGALPSPEIYAAMGEENILRMIEGFYEILHESSIAGMFSPDKKAAAHRSGAFFIQVLGGPARYLEQFGPPRMRMRHMPFKIDKSSRDIWVACFKKLLERAPQDFGFPSEHISGFIEWLEEFSLWMINTE